MQWKNLTRIEINEPTHRHMHMEQTLNSTNNNNKKKECVYSITDHGLMNCLAIGFILFTMLCCFFSYVSFCFIAHRLCLLLACIYYFFFSCFRHCVCVCMYMTRKPVCWSCDLECTHCTQVCWGMNCFDFCCVYSIEKKIAIAIENFKYKFFQLAGKT